MLNHSHLVNNVNQLCIVFGIEVKLCSRCISRCNRSQGLFRPVGYVAGSCLNGCTGNQCAACIIEANLDAALAGITGRGSMLFCNVAQGVSLTGGDGKSRACCRIIGGLHQQHAITCIFVAGIAPCHNRTGQAPFALKIVCLSAIGEDHRSLRNSVDRHAPKTNRHKAYDQRQTQQPRQSADELFVFQHCTISPFK